MNPLLSPEWCVPDAEARVWSDGRLYLYGSLDVPGRDEWCSDTYRVYSTGNLEQWTDHGVSFAKSQVPFATHRPLAAPDCVERNGRYYLFFCMNGDGGRQGVAWSRTPAGPFTEPRRIHEADQIDPAVLVDGDGRAYLFWGQVSLKGAELTSDMSATRPETLVTDILTESAAGFHEGASIRKIQGRYYLLYADVSRGRPTCLAYAIADRPLGPYRKRGIVIDNAESGYLAWNNHGSLVEFGNQWYVVYHRPSRRGPFNRRACMEPITIAPDGTIAEVQMTTQGPEPPLDAARPMSAWRACSYYGDVWNEVEDDREYVHSARSGSRAVYRFLRFSGQRGFHAVVRGEGSIDIHVGSAFWSSAGRLDVTSDGVWTRVTCRVEPYHGVGSVSLEFSRGTVDVREFAFVD
jgi:hypothetical protein